MRADHHHHHGAAFTKASKAEKDAVEQLALKAEPAVQKAVAAYLEKLAEGVALDDLIAALQIGDAGKVLQIVAGVATGAEQAAFTAALQEAVWGAAAAEAAGVALRAVDFSFDRLNPALINFLQTYSLGLIRQIGEDTRDAVRQALVAGMTAGASPIATARDVRQAVGLTKRQSLAAQNYRKELETFHLKTKAGGYNLGAKIDRVNGRQVFKPDADGNPKDGVDQRRLRDFRYDGQLQRAMDKTKPLKPDQIDKMVAAYARKYRRYRSEMIARTESLRATNYGVQEAWRQAIATNKMPEALVRRAWVLARDERTCSVCAPVPKLNPKRGVKFDQPFATPKGPVMLPPIHPNCRCTIFIRRYEESQLNDT
jgi:hypothetical protein